MRWIMKIHKYLFIKEKGLRSFMAAVQLFTTIKREVLKALTDLMSSCNNNLIKQAKHLGY